MSSVWAEEDRVLESIQKPTTSEMTNFYRNLKKEIVSADKFSVPRTILVSFTRGQQKMEEEQPWASSHQLRWDVGSWAKTVQIESACFRCLVKASHLSE